MKKRITLERIFQAPIADVWDLWTTKEGIESWWGPDGFAVTVRKIDLRPGGELHYAMTAVAAPQVEFMKRSNMPLTTENKLTYSEIVKHARLAYRHVVDFVPGVDPYEVEHVVEMEQRAQGVKMVLTFEAMHDEHWTGMARAGWDNELDKLGAALGKLR
jgi:uncharacterized protein YndB with AHSA1/START domain